MSLKAFTEIHKPGKLGLWCYSFVLIFAISFLTIPITGCSKEKIIEIPEKPEKPEEPGNSGVVILKPADVKDYDKIYKPADFKNIDLLRSDSKWSFVRSKQSDHFIVFWEEGFGENPNAETVPQDLRVNIDDLLSKAESFYEVNVNKLKFAKATNGTSNLDKYKMQIYLFYQTEWLATGGGYDDVIGALWVSPGTCKPVGSTIAHEIGHSFQYQTYCDLLAAGECESDLSRGFRYGFGGNGGNAFWEQTAQWQSFQTYPLEVFESYNFQVYVENCHRHICNEWQRYASYFIHYYLSDKYGIDFIGKLWREAVSPEDPLQAYIRMQGLTVKEFNAEMYEAATRFVTWDIESIRANGKNYIGKQAPKFYVNSDGYYQISYGSCPSSTGYNAIPLNVPAAGTVVKTSFTALQPGSSLASGDPGNCRDGENSIKVNSYNSSLITRAGWHYGYVALLENGQRVYGEMHRKTKEDVEFVIPSGCEKLWFVVLGAPSSYLPHAWDEKERNDDQWPYTVKFTNTDLLGNITIDPTATPGNITLTYNLAFPADASAYSGTKVNLSENGDMLKLAQAFVLQPSDITSKLLQAKQAPQEGMIAFAAKESDGSLNYITTANDLGFWFDSKGNVIGWGSNNDSKIFSELNRSDLEFTIGQYPGKNKAGDKYTIKEVLVYTKGGVQYEATFVFNITIN